MYRHLVKKSSVLQRTISLTREQDERLARLVAKEKKRDPTTAMSRVVRRIFDAGIAVVEKGAA